ncbi:hypothetical protein M430DRAFT_232858 [Amorphotheca resinae ATCC 22711]|uniref:Uncharacterized protein n=1 Tax=Amorphotheca resinae ATCC 22711 TaxID=857342 RepID=A0A2T3B3Y5_AMORE|nr:hypothetical protein M430DRAFT_232858 [Amorphotheca resinae ATCC 22711]PSS20359.1 hypothetical protein M430DRAFT_232858 [Amorphotheca resinae ATCC 22711]
MAHLRRDIDLGEVTYPIIAFRCDPPIPYSFIPRHLEELHPFTPPLVRVRNELVLDSDITSPFIYAVIAPPRMGDRNPLYCKDRTHQIVSRILMLDARHVYLPLIVMSASPVFGAILGISCSVPEAAVVTETGCSLFSSFPVLKGWEGAIHSRFSILVVSGSV